MALQTKPLAIGGAAIGGIGAVGGGVYAATRPGTISNQLGAEGLLSTEEETNKEEFKELLTKLKSHSGSSLSLTKELKQLKTNNETNSGKELRDWCKKTYKEKYQGETDDLGKLSNLYCKKSSIGEKLEEIKLPENNFDIEGNEKIKKAKKDTNGIKDEKLKGELSNSVENNAKSILISGCKDKYTKPFDTKLNLNSEEKLLDEVKSFCTLTIKEKIGEENLLSKDTETKIGKEAQEKKLKAETSATDLAVLFKDLHEKLKKTEPAVKDEETKDVCLSVYEKGYRGEDDKLFKNVKKYCSYTIKDKLTSVANVTESNLFIETEEISTSDANLKGKMDSLTTTTDGSNADLQTKFSEGKTGKDDVKKQKEFRSGCQELYKKQGDGKDENTNGIYKLAHTHCKKS